MAEFLSNRGKGAMTDPEPVRLEVVLKAAQQTPSLCCTQGLLGQCPLNNRFDKLPVDHNDLAPIC